MTSDVDVESGKSAGGTSCWRYAAVLDRRGFWQFFAVGLAVFYFRPRLPRRARGTRARHDPGELVLLLSERRFSAGWVDAPYFVCESLMPAALAPVAVLSRACAAPASLAGVGRCTRRSCWSP